MTQFGIPFTSSIEYVQTLGSRLWVYTWTGFVPSNNDNPLLHRSKFKVRYTSSAGGGFGGIACCILLLKIKNIVFVLHLHQHNTNNHEQNTNVLGSLF